MCVPADATSPVSQWISWLGENQGGRERGKGGGRFWIRGGLEEGRKHVPGVNAGLPEHLDPRTRADRRGPHARGQVSEERCQGLRGPRERNMVRDRTANAQNVRRGGVNLFRGKSCCNQRREEAGEQRTLHTMSFRGEPCMRAAIEFSCTRQSGDMRSPGLAFAGSRRGGIPLAGRARGR